MAKKKKDHTGFRNGDLFCFNCGRAQKLPLPMEMGLAGDFMMSFAKRHKDCPKIWVEPSPDETKNMQTAEEKMNWWRVRGEHGTSSEVIFSVIGQRRSMVGGGHPSDPDDFRRCWLLLEAIPEWKTELDKLRPVSKIWNILVSHWSQLTEMLIEGMKINSGEKMYDFMKSIGVE